MIERSESEHRTAWHDTHSGTVHRCRSAHVRACIGMHSIDVRVRASKPREHRAHSRARALRALTARARPSLVRARPQDFAIIERRIRELAAGVCAAHVAAVGDQVAPEVVVRAPSRLYELTVGLVSAAIAAATRHLGHWGIRAFGREDM